jgi:hypothetical protein
MSEGATSSGPDRAQPDPAVPDAALPDAALPDAEGADRPAPLAANGQGTAWLYEFDLAGLLADLGLADLSKEAEQQALASCPSAPVDLSGRIAEALPTGPGLAACLAQTSPETSTDRDLVGIAAAYRRLASWAQAGELAAVAQVSARCAARNPRVGVDDDGQPRQVLPDAAAQIALELAMTQQGAQAWASLAVRMRWQLPGTGAALADGTIDLTRAKIIAEATSVLPDELAQRVESQVLPAAGDQTYGQLRASAYRAVIAADPEGAEQRRRDGERRARLSLYPDADGTAALVGSSLPGVHAAAAMARISAMARALKSSGAPGSLDLLRACIFMGLLLGTGPLIPPPEGAPPDQPPPDDPWAGGTPRAGAPDGAAAPDAPPEDDVNDGQPELRDAPPPSGDADGDEPRDDSEATNSQPDNGQACPYDDVPPPSDADGDEPRDDSEATNSDPDNGQACAWDDVPPPGDADAPAIDDYDPSDADGGAESRLECDLDDDESDWAPPLWPALPAVLPASTMPPGTADPPADTSPSTETGPPADTGLSTDTGPPIGTGQSSGTRKPGAPPAGLLDLVIPWRTLTGAANVPAVLGRLGPVTADQASKIVDLAIRSPATQWRIIVTDEEGRALAVERARVRADGAPSPPGTIGIVGRVTVTMPASAVDGARTASPKPNARDVTLAAIARAALRATQRAQDEARAFAAAGGSCDHGSASAAYRPPPRIREHVTARDVTCRFGTCGQPAWRADLDHTIPVRHEVAHSERARRLEGWSMRIGGVAPG